MYYLLLDLIRIRRNSSLGPKSCAKVKAVWVPTLEEHSVSLYSAMVRGGKQSRRDGKKSVERAPLDLTTKRSA